MSKIEPFSLTVDGSAEIPLPAERAIINVVVSSEGLNKADVSSEIITAAMKVEKLLRQLSPSDETSAAKEGSPLAHWSKTSLSATSYIPPRRNGEEKEPRHYKGNIMFDIRFKEFRALGSFSTTLSAIPHVEVNSINWILTDETHDKHRSQLRKDAARDAMAKARDYCEVLGCVNLRPVKLDRGYSDRGPRYARASQEIGGYGDDDERVEEVGLEFTPQEVRMTMEVTITFHADAAAKST